MFAICLLCGYLYLKGTPTNHYSLAGLDGKVLHLQDITRNLQSFYSKTCNCWLPSACCNHIKDVQKLLGAIELNCYRFLSSIDKSLSLFTLSRYDLFSFVKVFLDLSSFPGDSLKKENQKPPSLKSPNSCSQVSAGFLGIKLLALLGGGRAGLIV